MKITILTSLLTTGAQGGYYAITTWLPSYLKGQGLSDIGSSGYLAVVIAGSFAGFVAAAYASDRLGRKYTFFLFAAGSALIAILYTQIPITDALMLFLGFPLGFFVSGNFSGCGPFLTELYPSRVRGSGQGFTYNFGRGVSAFATPLVGYLSSTMGLGKAIGVVAVAGFAVVILVVALLPETRGKALAVYD